MPRDMEKSLEDMAKIISEHENDVLEIAIRCYNLGVDDVKNHIIEIAKENPLKKAGVFKWQKK